MTFKQSCSQQYLTSTMEANSKNPIGLPKDSLKVKSKV